MPHDSALIDRAPAANLALPNRVLVDDRRPADFCTVVQAGLCPGEDALTVRRAHGGHPPALILQADGSVESVEDGRGPLVGVATLAAQRGRSAHDVIEAVTGSALRLQQGAARDDIAVLAIRVQPVS